MIETASLRPEAMRMALVLATADNVKKAPAPR
jgi:hypothetical protein